MGPFLKGIRANLGPSQKGVRANLGFSLKGLRANLECSFREHPKFVWTPFRDGPKFARALFWGGRKFARILLRKGPNFARTPFRDSRPEERHEKAMKAEKINRHARTSSLGHQYPANVVFCLTFELALPNLGRTRVLLFGGSVLSVVAVQISQQFRRGLHNELQVYISLAL